MPVTYDPETILSLKLRHSLMPRLSRNEMWSRMQLLQVINPIVEEAYAAVSHRRWRLQLDDSPHGHPWHTSFHASQFPGDSMACGRAAMYQLMDLPKKVAPRRLQLTATAGKAMEVDLVNMLDQHGRLISAPPDAEVQTGFEIPELMLTGTVDSAISIGGRPVPVEIKTKHESQIEEMRLGQRGPDDKHVAQLKAQLGLIRDAQESGQLWSEMKPLEYGYIYYLPRDTKYNPSLSVPTAEFYVEYDKKFFETGLENLRKFIGYWNDEVLPHVETKGTKSKHPMGWRWSYSPCKFCDYKKICQADHKAGITDLSESTGIEDNPRVTYSYEAARQRVEDRWSDE